MRERRGRKDDQDSRSPTNQIECPYKWRNIPALRCILNAAVLSDETEMLMHLYYAIGLPTVVASRLDIFVST